MMIEDVMYGVMLKAKMDIEEKDPPVMALKKPKAFVVCLANQSAKNDVSIPGMGSWEPKRMTTSIMKV